MSWVFMYYISQTYFPVSTCNSTIFLSTAAYTFSDEHIISLQNNEINIFNQVFLPAWTRIFLRLLEVKLQGWKAFASLDSARPPSEKGTLISAVAFENNSFLFSNFPTWHWKLCLSFILTGMSSYVCGYL